MSEYNKEQLSSLIDGEYEGNNDKAFDNLMDNQEMIKTWSRYHLIGDCLREHLPERISSQVFTQVTNALINEPTVFAPKKVKKINLNPFVGFAVAASVAIVALFSIQNSNNNNLASNNDSFAANTAIPSEIQTFSFSRTQLLPDNSRKLGSQEEVASQRLNNYLMNHNQYRSNGNMNGIFPYARLVTIESQE
ncbi:MAG: hypothetical protein CMF45_02185 [Legionellales bacterium]|nr:hypothetical protein [Legionellales bacterium]